MKGRALNELDRERLIEAYEKGNDHISLADAMGIKRRTAYRIIADFKRSGKRKAFKGGGAPPKKMTEEMKETLVHFVEEKPTATLSEMRAFLLREYPEVEVSQSTIRRHLEGALITLKLLRSVPISWISDEVKDERAEFSRWMLSEGITKNLVYLDECGYNLWTARTQGRASRGQRAIRIVDRQRGKNLTLCLAVSPAHGLVHHFFVEGGMTKEKFSDFLSELSTLFAETDLCIVFDNAPPHRDPPLLQHESHETRALPRYSPFLNITENAISCAKSYAKQELSAPETQVEISDRERAYRNGLTLHQHRMTILKNIVLNSLPQITALKCSAWFRKSLTYLEACRERRDILD